MKYLILFLFISVGLFKINSQVDLAQKEIELNEKLLDFRSAKTDQEINKKGLEFKNAMLNFLKLDGAFTYTFTQLKTVAIIDSPDNYVRIVNWNLEYTDLSYAYAAFVMKLESEDERIKIIELVDKLDPYTVKPEGVIDAKNWYGALYYKIIPVEYNDKMEYTLLGWDGGTSGSNFKIIDVLSFTANSAKLGSPLFIKKKTTSKRIIFEYSDKSTMSLKYDDKNKRIVFDHLMPESASLVGVFSYYVPDFSYDSYIWQEDKWVLEEDVIAVNNAGTNKHQTIYTLDPKTGKTKEEKIKEDWVNPEDPSKKGDIGHVARTVESEALLNSDSETLDVKVKRNKRDRRTPDGLSVTTGKYKKKNRRTTKP
jgi:hypothetical protein